MSTATERIDSLEATAALAQRIAVAIQPGDILHMDGPMGAGKTTFTRAFVAALDGDPDLVTSPTYTLMHVYDARLPIVHVDAYRLSAAEELDGIGFEEQCGTDGVGVIEWAARVGNVASDNAGWHLTLQPLPDGGREATIQAPEGRHW